MPFQPAVNDVVPIDGVSYRIAEHPAAPGMPNGQEGRQATVYELVNGGERRALKVLKPRYRFPSVVPLSQHLTAYADIPGLEVCKRTVLTEQRQRQLLTRFPDLNYSSLMPWIDGPTWMEVLLDKRPFSQDGSIRLARSMAGLLATLERRDAAHCDLSGANVLLPALRTGNGHSARSDLALVDVDQMYGKGMARPGAVPAGSPGYGHATAANGVWQPDADRFAGAVLIAEMAGWCDDRVRNAAWGESYFDPTDIGRDCPRYRTLSTTLRGRWGNAVADLFEQAWSSSSLAKCATFAEWERVLAPAQQPEEAPAPKTAGGADGDSDQAAYALLAMGRSIEAKGNLASALATYRQALQVAPPSSRVVAELEEAIRALGATVAGSRSTIGTQTGSNTFTGMADEDLQKLFRDGRVALYGGDLLRAKDLLLTVARSRPGYFQDGQTVEQLLAMIQSKQTTTPKPKAQPAGTTPTWTPTMTPMTGKPSGTSSRSSSIPPPTSATSPSSDSEVDGCLKAAGIATLIVLGFVALVLILGAIGAAMGQSRRGSEQLPATVTPVAQRTLAPAIRDASVAVVRTSPPTPPPRGLSSPTYIVNSLDVGCHSAPNAGASIDARLAPGSIQVMDLVQDTDGAWQHDADRLCWTRVDPGPVRQFGSFPQAVDYAATVPHRPGETILADKLNDASRGVLPNLTGTQGSRLAYTDGEYLVAKTNPSDPRPAFAPLPGTYGDSALSVDVRLIGQTLGRYVEIGCRQQQTDGYSAYSLVVEPYGGRFGLARWDNGRQVDLVSLRSSAAISRGNQNNRLTLSCSGNAISASLNGIQIATAQDSTYKEGNIWIGVGTYTDGTAPTAEGRFSNLSLVKR